MTPIRAIIGRATVAACGLILLAGLTACGNKNTVITCDEAQPYQSIVAGKRVVVPDGLDELDKFKEMPVPRAETPERPEGAGCVENPPSILSGKSTTT